MKRNILLPSAILFGVGLVAPLGAYAQATFSLGPRIGVQRTHQSDVSPAFEIFGELTGDPHRFGAQAGLAGNVQFSHWAIQPAVLYSQKGYTYEQRGMYYYPSGSYHVSAKRELTINYLEVPVNLVVSTGEQDGFQLIAGLYGALALNGRNKERATIDEEPADPFGFGSYAKNYRRDEKLTFGSYTRYDLGLNSGLGYKRNALQLQALYGVGLRRTSNRQQSDGTFNRSIQVAISYFLPLSR
ncbi:porin family protein [Hymenobacter wooponensis]|uniref:PorT family protein n=1 Tax=Hymenobacter wooponensis TaxID=1525360 RepID=A0A4Z0MQB5_9BACT|nr:porin family protein [Hymenobacter wooponensis]TGD81851.1 PorT family protein [Hymenobacter wooponensis]